MRASFGLLQKLIKVLDNNIMAMPTVVNSPFRPMTPSIDPGAPPSVPWCKGWVINVPTNLNLRYFFSICNKNTRNFKCFILRLMWFNF